MPPRPRYRATIGTRTYYTLPAALSSFASGRLTGAFRQAQFTVSRIWPQAGSVVIVKVAVDAEVNEVLDVLVVPQTQLLHVGSSGASVTTLSCELIVENLVMDRLAENAGTHDKS